MAERRFLVRAGLKRNYGKHEVYYELSEEISASSTGQVRDAFINLQSLLEEQITVYEATSLPHVTLPDSRNNQNGAATSGESFALETIKISNEDGQRKVKACGGKFTKHGVPVYPECSSAIKFDGLDYGVHDMRSHKLTVVYELEGGKPKRAVSIK